MAHGLQVFNADGTLQFDTSGRLFRVLTATSSGTGNGSIPVSGTETGTVAAYVDPKAAPSAGYAAKPPNVSVGGGLVSWDFGSTPPDERADSNIVVVVF